MCDVTKFNFEDIFPEIEESLKKAVFISVDCEFSALYVKDEYRGSLFDTPSQRYRKLRCNLEHSIPLEIGLTSFTFDRDNILYIAKPYKFYVFPANFGNLDNIFVCQSSGFHFLSEHNFDFNKVVYSGIPFLNISKEQQILNQINDSKLYEYCKYCLNNICHREIATILTEISEWFYSQTNEMEKTVCNIAGKNICKTFIIHSDIRNRFPRHLWTFEENHHLKVKRVTEEEYEELNNKISLEQKVLLSALGFTRIFRLLTTLKKPLVGHNLLNDLILLMNTFEQLVPKHYNHFKQLIITRFPTIFDTKTISFELLKHLSDDKKWRTNSLEELYEYFKNELGRHLVPGSPRIELAENFKTYTEDKFHDAGWDAYCTGYCFLRMAHFFASKEQEHNNKNVFMSSELLKSLNRFKNHVNLIRGTTPYLNLSGKDPESLRPPCLIIQSTNHKPIDIFKVTELLREYGSVDIKPYSQNGRRAIAAVANFGSARRILGRFQNHDDFKIITYNTIKHSPVVRAALWSGAIASGSILAWLLHSQIIKSS